jgi:Protein of unknown function (DUF3619)
MSDQTEFERHMREQLLASSDALDGRTRSRLTQARYKALEQAKRSQGARLFGWRGLAPAGAVAMALLVTVFYVRQRDSALPVTGFVATAATSTALDDLALLADADGYALSSDVDQELDSEFYEWAAASALNDGSST